MRAASDTHDRAYSPQSGDDIERHVRGSRGKLQPAAENERRESELVGFLSALRTQDDSSYVTWRCISIDGSERVWRTKPILTTEATLDDIIEEK